MANNCFEDMNPENIDDCANTEIPAGISEVGIRYAIHSQITTFPMPLNPGDPLFTYEKAVTVTEALVFAAGKGFANLKVQPDTGEVKLDLVGNKGNKKTKSSFDFFVPGNDKKKLGFVRTLKNTPLLISVPERDGQNRFIGDKYNPAYITEAAATTGKTGEDDKGIHFTIEAYGVPIVYEGAFQMFTPA